MSGIFVGWRRSEDRTPTSNGFCYVPRRLLSGVLCLLLLLSIMTGCSAGPEQHTVTYLDLFDTVTTVVSQAESREAFDILTSEIHDSLLEYHRLFDIYNDYPQLQNLKTVNDKAGQEPVPVDGRIIALLLDCRDYYEITGGKVDVTMGSVLQLWHEARSAAIDDTENARLPEPRALEAAAAHRGWEYVQIDPAASTVYITDPQVRLDVGAVAKGWAVQQVAQTLPAGILISLGGNVVATGPKDEVGTPWVVGIQDPEAGDRLLHTLCLTGGSAVTSGDYQRGYQVDGKWYHHIIDPNTLYPSEYWRSVTILCQDSALADALSTALFLLPQAEGQVLLDRCGAEAMWVDEKGQLYYSPGFAAYVQD